MTAKLFEAALGIAAPWSVQSVEFDESTKVLDGATSTSSQAAASR